MGAIGNGHFAKALNNLLGTVNYLAACEAFIVAAKAGLDPAGLADVINSSGGKSQATERRVPEWLRREFGEPGSGMALDLWIKDVATACGMGRETSLAMPLSTLAHQLLIQITNELGGNLPNNSIPLAYENWGRVGTAPERVGEKSSATCASQGHCCKREKHLAFPLGTREGQDRGLAAPCQGNYIQGRPAFDSEWMPDSGGCVGKLLRLHVHKLLQGDVPQACSNPSSTRRCGGARPPGWAPGFAT